MLLWPVFLSVHWLNGLHKQFKFFNKLWTNESELCYNPFKNSIYRK
ncbi:hypothetical protein I656_03334 [Geobacillus sp. WSUCF1]|nr:hypothetical protein I656_03334 [Geobacillus sp. WSUCF1]